MNKSGESTYIERVSWQLILWDLLIDWTHAKWSDCRILTAIRDEEMVDQNRGKTYIEGLAFLHRVSSQNTDGSGWENHTDRQPR